MLKVTKNVYGLTIDKISSASKALRRSKFDEILEF